MTVTIDLRPEEAARLRDLAERQGLNAEEFVRRIIEERLASPVSGEPERPLNGSEIDRRLKAAGVGLGNRECAVALLDRWDREDADPEGTVEEWAHIQRNIERGIKWR